MKRFFILTLAIFAMAILSTELSAKVIEKTVVVDGEELEITFKVKNPEKSYFVKHELPRLMENAGVADWYVCEVGGEVDPAICIAKVANGQVIEYYEVSDSEYDDFPLGLIGDLATLVMNLKGGETIATDDSICWGSDCSNSPIMGQMKLLNTVVKKRPMDMFGSDSDTYLVFKCNEQPPVATK